MFGSHSVGIRWWYSLAGRYRTGLSECNDGDLSSFRFLRLHCPLSKICLTTYSKNWISRVLVGFGQHDCFFDWQESQEDQISVCGIAGNESVLLDNDGYYWLSCCGSPWCLGLFLCFVKNGDCLNAALSETVVIVMLLWECLTLFGRTFYGGPIMWINFHPLFKGGSLMLL